MSQRRHIAFFTNTYHPVVSGVVRSVSTFRESLIELGHNVFVFAQHANHQSDSQPFIFRYPALDLPLTKNFPLAIPVSPFIDRLLPLLKADVIHSHHPFLLGRAAVKKSEELKVPLVFTFHTRYRDYSHYVPLEQTMVKKVIERWLGEYMRKCHHIVVPSDSIKAMLAETYGATEQVSTIPTGIEVEPFRAARRETIRQERGWAEDIVLISIGRLAEEKNWKTLLKAAASVMSGRGGVRLVIIGDGEDRKELETYAADLNIRQQVEFTGQVPFAEVPGYLKAADIFCFASVTETQGLVTMEAMAADLPVVAVDGSGTRDVVEEGQDGLLTPDDSEALAEAIRRVVDDEDLFQQLKQNARQKAATFDAGRQAEKLLDVYEQADEAQKAGRYVTVEPSEELFDFSLDEAWWQKMFGPPST